MIRRFLAVVVATAVLAPPLPALAQRFVTFSYSTLGVGIATRATDLGLDSSGRTWVTTDQGVSAVADGDRRAEFFPFRGSNDGLLANEVRAVTFGTVGTDNVFFLGFPEGIQWGRIANGLDLRGDLVIQPSSDARNSVNDLASDGSATVWAATAGGLVEWDISGEAPSEGDTFDLGATSHVAAAPWSGDPAALAASGQRLYVVRAGGTTPTGPLETFTDNIQDLAFDAAGNLFVLTNRGGGNGGDIVLYGPPTTSGGDPVRLGAATRFNPSLRTVSSLAVDLYTNTVWIGTDLGAYFQVPSGATLNSALCASGDTSGVDCWALDTTSNFTQADRIDKILADLLGNSWFGTSRGLKGRIVRLLALNASQYLGDGASAVVTLEDLPTFSGNGNPDTATVEVSVGSATQDVTAEEQPGDAGRFSFTVRLADIGTVPGADGTDVQVTYSFQDANGEPRTIARTARWANIVDFEDDLWIGGPCFLRSLAP